MICRQHQVLHCSSVYFVAPVDFLSIVVMLEFDVDCYCGFSVHIVDVFC